MAKNWNEMSAAERQESMFERWANPLNVKFMNAAAEKAYKERVTRLKDAIQLKKCPDRTPVFLIIGFYPATYSGMTAHQAMYDYDGLVKAWKKYTLDFEPDAHLGAAIPTAGKVFDILDYKLYAWPGHGVPENLAYQFNEGEYMMADEYDAFIEDPNYFFTTTYMPRICGELAGLKDVNNLANIQEMLFLGPNILSFGLPHVQAAYKKLFEAGEEALKWISAVGKFDAEAAALGYPNFFGGFSKAPFDTLGDTLRGTRGIMVDMYRRPEKLIAAMERIVPLMIRMAVSGAKMSGNPIIFMPLHKGADGFMNDAQFKKFYWPTFKKVLEGLIAEGCVPFPWAEGGYNSRLEVIKDMPKGTVLWGFDSTDMKRAKQVLGGISCIGGNVPMSLLQIASPKDITDYCQDLDKTCGKDGGFILMNGATIDEVKPENLHAMINSVKKK
jgi:hypothetical protein